MVSYNEQDGIPTETVHALYEGNSGNVYAVVGNWNIAQFHHDHFSTAQPSLPSGAVHGWNSQVAYLDREGEWWLLLATKGLGRYGKAENIRALNHRKPFAMYTHRDGLPSDLVSRMYEDVRGDYWVSSRSGVAEGTGVSRWNRRSRKFQIYSEREGLPSHISLSAVCEDSSGNLWMGFYQGGVARYSNGRFKFWSISEGAPDEMTTSLYTDHTGSLWIGSNKEGVRVVKNVDGDNLEYTSYTTKQGLSTDNVRCIVEDRWGRMYFGTVHGIDRLDRSTGLVTHFSQSEGLPNEWVVSALRDKEGDLWFGTMYGLSRLTPRLEEFAGSERHPPIYLSTVRVNGVPNFVSEFGTLQMDDIQLEPSENTVGIDFFSIGSSGGIRYQYKLNGSDDAWSRPVVERTVNFASLSPGVYEFEVRAISPDGTLSLVPAHFHFSILAPFWQRWWFVVTASFAAFTMLYGFYRYRIRKAVELERLRVRIASDLHDEVGSALTQIAVHSEIIQRADKPERVLSSSQTIGTVSREVLRTLADIVWSIDARHDTLGQLTNRMKSFALDFLVPKNIEVRFHFEGISTEKKIPVGLRENLYLIYKESLTNIAKHSNASSVNVSLHETNGQLMLEVRDNGQGIVDEKADAGHGLKNMKLRAERIAGTLTFRNSEGFQITLTTKAP
jgi:anti-sigma regulatory factor (Ser/Thr protein kinase)